MRSNPWFPFKPKPQYVVRVSLWTAVRNKLSEKWSVIYQKCIWKYYCLVYQTANQHEIRRAMATEQAQHLYKLRAPVRAVEKKLVEGVLDSLQSDVQVILARGTIEYNGWRELPNSLNAVLFLSWTPTVGSRLYRICAPSMAVIVRDRFGKDEFDPHFADEIYKIPDGKHFIINPGIRDDKRLLTVEKESAVIAETLIALATAIQVEEKLHGAEGW